MLCMMIRCWFQSLWLQHTFKNDTLLFKYINLENRIIKLSHYPWFNTPGGLGSFTILLKTHILFTNGGNIVGVFKFNILEDAAAISCVWWLGVEMVGMICWYFLLSHKTVCRHYLWCLHHSGWYSRNTKHNCFDFCL